MGLKRTSHSVYDTSYHLVWCPKYRKDIFERVEVKERAEQLIKEICEDYGFEIIELEVGLEHIHILVSFPPTKSIGEVVRIIKSHSGRGFVPRVPRTEKETVGGGVVGRRIFRQDSWRPNDSASD